MTSLGASFDRGLPVLDARIWRPGDWLVLGALALVLVPDLVMFAGSYWFSDRGMHGAIIVGLGGWLLLREWPRADTGRGNVRIAAPLLLLCLVAHALFTIIGSHGMVWATACATLAVVVYDRIGLHGLQHVWFPLAFLLLAVPPSGRLMTLLTYGLTDALSAASVELLWSLGWEIARDRTTIYLGPYELLVVDACAGLNSMISLFAMGMFFLYIRRDSAPWRLAVLGVLVLPIVIFSGLARTLALLLLTDGLGDRAAQGGLHDLTGLVMFGMAFAIFTFFDHLLPRATRQSAPA